VQRDGAPSLAALDLAQAQQLRTVLVKGKAVLRV
jgi:hypothetical protein